MSNPREPLPEPVHRFHDSVVTAGADQPVCAGEHHGLFTVLQHWSDFNGFEECAFMVKSLFRFWNNANPSSQNFKRDHARASILLRAFGLTFRGDEVGVLGHDIIGKALTSSSVEIRDAAIMALEKWCEDDEDWLGLVAEHRDREETALLKDYCTQILDTYEWGVGEPEDDGAGGDPDGDRFSAGPELSQDFLEPPSACPPEVEAFLDVTRPLVLHMIEAKQLPTEKLHRVLTNLVGLHHDTVLDLVESYQIGRKTERPTNLNVWVGDWTDAGKSLYCWSEEWGFWMSDESSYSTGPSEGSRWHIKLFA